MTTDQKQADECREAFEKKACEEWEGRTIPHNAWLGFQWGWQARGEAQHLPDLRAVREALEDCLEVEGVAHRKVRDALALLTTPQAAPADRLVSMKENVTELLAEKEGYWYSCSGCHESGEYGGNEHNYPYSEVFQCHPGSGCHECGGIGVRWDNTDYSDFGNENPAPARSDKAQVVERVAEKINAEAGIGIILSEVAAEAALSALPPTRDESGLAGNLELANDALASARAKLVENGYPDLPFLCDGIQNAINQLRAENDLLTSEAIAGRQAEAEADAEAKQLAEALKSAFGCLCACRHVKPIDGELLDAEITQAKAVLARYEANVKAVES